MHCLLAVVFDEESKANEGKQALLQLEAEGGVIIHGYALVAKDSDGNAIVSYEDELRPFFTFGSGSRSENGPSGGLAAWGHAAAGVESPRAPAQWDNSRIAEGFIDDVKRVMLSNRVVLVADIEEEFPIAVDTRMESRGGVVFRWTIEE